MLKVENVTKVYKVGTFGGRTLTAVDAVSFEVRAGEVVSLIGESGSGKSTIGKMILGLIPMTGGSITVDGVPVKPGKEYYRTVQGVFQDPFSCYNPVFKADRVFQMIKDSYYPSVPGREWTERVHAAIEDVRLNPREVLGKFPHQLSGGQLQRLLIARALLLDLKLLIADEITSMLDASTRIDVLNLLAELKGRGLSVLYVTHDLSLGHYLAERTVVLRDGAVVEMGPTHQVFDNPLHPYTRQLLSSVPRLHAPWEDAAPVETCPYHERGATGGLAEAEPGHFVACARLDECRGEPT
ncbi:ATP-binding cassette domain-containing protein [Nonomuraea sp. MCN248]|uniref:ATP-binding cassette domain-containing protein n=1 Tax=Nonomuraea corallina TaxID=2989783 RepID=A0ABT4S593_9ACTN|nr:ATP-binding cassette domain-containing protein [Nonomuraea corallina]MDA0632346.1 ATP-binding cassette domain-containing protein [Nonomuraea corallina]